MNKYIVCDDNVFIRGSSFCVVTKTPNEITDCYLYRGCKIIEQKPTNQNDFDKYVHLSNYLSNIKFLRCTYSPNVHLECAKMDQ